MKMSKGKRAKKWLEFNKAGMICVGITLLYVLIMLGIIYGLGGKLFVCNSGSLSDTLVETVEVQTSDSTEKPEPLEEETTDSEEETTK